MSVEVGVLMQVLLPLLKEALPYAVARGEEVGKGAAKEIGADSYRQAKALWGKLWPKLRRRKDAREAVEKAAAEPEDAGAQELLALHLQLLLAQNAALREEVARTVETLRAAPSAAVTAAVRGGGAIAQGAGAVAAGKRSIVAGRDLHLHVSRKGAEGAADLRRSYLELVMRETGFLSLSGIDPAVGGSSDLQDTRLSLDAVYTALSTRTPRRSERGPDEVKIDPETERLTAVEQLGRQRHLVLLGDPGSGKSTFVNFVALCLAGEALGDPRANLKLLTTPSEDEDEEKPKPRPWKPGRLLPVRIVLRDLAARGLPPPGEPAGADHLCRFLEGELAAHRLAAFVPHLERELRSRGGLLLLDGLDEVPEGERRREQIRGMIESFVGSFGRCRVLLTSRTYAYQKQEWRVPGFAEAGLAPFSAGQIRRFISLWYDQAAVLGRFRPEDAAGKAAQLAATVFANDRLLALAERPLLLTLMASLHAWRGGTLPQRREELYADAVQLLLDFWERRRVEHSAGGRMIERQPSVAAFLGVDQERVRQVLEELAFAAHHDQPEAAGTADVPQGALLVRLAALKAGVNPVDLEDYLRDRAGLLIERGVGVYTFPHRTFQEYLAACALTRRDDFLAETARLGRRDPGRWREVVLLAGAKAAHGFPASVWQLAEVCDLDAESPVRSEEEVWGARLAGQLVAESAVLSGLSRPNQRKLERLRAWHVHLLGESRLPARERAAAGDVLAWLGDPRFAPERWFLPRDPFAGFVEVPAGRFSMGSGEQRHEVDLPAFWIGRFPVTVAQLGEFACGREPELERWLGGRVANHPAALVTWHEALAYCGWLEERLRELAPRRLAEDGEESRAAPFWQGWLAGEWRVTLPSEAEWEKAARGSDGRAFPWGDEADAERANVARTGLGGTSPAGCFPSGASPFGCEEMSGNVWEWTRSARAAYPDDPADGREELTTNSSRVARGGSFASFIDLARAAARGGDDPTLRGWSIGFRLVVRPFSSGL